MCGRYSLEWDVDELARHFGLVVRQMPRLEPRYNIAPSQPIAIVHDNRDRDERRMTLVQWGLVPFWADDPSIGQRMINARSETAATKPAYKAAMKYRRCVVPASGFYEWQAQPSGKQPHYFHPTADEPLALAGLYEHWTGPDGEEIDTGTILTTQANAAVKPIHDRMPVILRLDDVPRWLDAGEQDPAAVTDLLQPAPDDLLTRHAVSKRINRPGPDDPSLIDPIQTDGELF